MSQQQINPQVKKNPDPTLDAFSRLRVSNPTTIFSSQANYDYDPLQYEIGNTGNGVAPTYNTTNGMLRLSCAAGTGTSWVQTWQYHQYQPGKSFLVFATGVFDDAVAGYTTDIGLFDDNNGIFVRQNGLDGLQLVLRSSNGGRVENTVVNQADWNLDTLLGNGETANPSGWRFDENLNWIFVADLQFLGMGRIRIYFDIDGYLIPVHEFDNANTITGTYMRTACLPVRMQITGTDTAAAKGAWFKCASVNSEGGEVNDFKYHFSTGSVTGTAGNDARAHLLSIRPAATFNGLAYRGLITPDTFDLLVTGNQIVFYELVMGAEFSVAPTWAAVNAFSGVEVGTGGTYSGLTGGYVIESGYVVANASNKTQNTAFLNLRLALTLNRAGAQRAGGTLSVLVTGIGGTSACRGSLSYFEQR